ncbi:chromosome transmission fidelity protein 18 homolog [Amyelois transitella]|uniref:chromosome transmission fidelity protein 18 homolog n=1 Tax=Amyelois transitella TaxID=680683 RepID=UPI00298F53E0|nr:chromosome transmission fidelity protein 18 homolog [Amyelois transitella]
MSDYPDPDEEYELMYADELELIRESEENFEPNIIKKKQLPAKRSLDFSSPVQQKPKPVETVEDDIQSLPLTPNLPPVEELLLTPVSSKRTADELFGDINDINFDEVELPSKRQKTEEDNDLDLINRIIETRKLKQMLLEPSRAQSNVKPVFDAKDNISLDIPRWPFMPVTNSDGDRFYVRLESEEIWDKQLCVASEQLSLRTTYAKAWEEAQKYLEEKEKQTILSEEPVLEVEVESATDINSNNLWVEKYRPKSYIDLLSEEPVNRALLHWLHLWDKIVFKKEVKTKEPQQRNTFSKRTGQFQMTNHWRGKKEAEPEMDEDGRPRHKVALLCGPPGVGKTTLAHLLANLAGYRPVELNASDERSTEAFRTALQNATMMKSVLDKDRRPNCLILDEIDGAPLPTVELLVKWCTATISDGKKKAKSQPLRRPVIAICNDLYATSLRPLRPVALIIHVQGVSAPRLASRLALVARREHVRAAPHALAALAARCCGDVRAAVLLLGFVRARRAAQLKMEDVMTASIGTKDCSKTMMQALQAIFTVNDQDPSVIMKTIQAAGEYDRLADGIFENYLCARVDSRLHIACETLNWLRLYDAINRWTLRTQNYSLYGALPLCIARCHALLASRTPQRVKFPTQAQEMYRKKLELDSIVDSVWRGSSPTVVLPKTALRLDLVPMLPYLLSPTLRSANVQLCSESERKTIESLAGAMCDYGLQFAQRRASDGLYALVLEPEVFRAALFGNEERIRLSPAVRQAIARAQQLEVIRRNEELMNRTSGKTMSRQGLQSSQNPKVKEPPKVEDTRLPNHLQRLQPKAVEKSAPQVHKDFFGRIVPMSQVQRSDAVPDVISSSSVFYQYREGFNNAVRRNVRTKDLL